MSWLDLHPCDKYYDTKHLGRKAFIWLYPSPSQSISREVRPELQQARKLEARTKEEHRLLASSPRTAQPAFLSNPRPLVPQQCFSQWAGPFNIGNQSRKCSTGLSTGQSDGAMFPIEAPPSQMTVAPGKLTNTKLPITPCLNEGGE